MPMPGGEPGSSGQPPAGGGTQSGAGQPPGMPSDGRQMPGELPGGGAGTPGGPEAGGTGGARAGGEEGWETGLPGSGDDGWETSNQVPGGGESRIPPMPSERGRPPGSGDGELDGALEDFDGEILAEREVIRQRSNETAGTGGTNLPQAGGTGGQSGEGGESGTGIPGAPGGVEMPTRGGPMGVPSNRNTPPPPSPAATASVPDDIPDARDDDIIARQLREAAMQETDPELKEKLWDEYRRYKGI